MKPKSIEPWIIFEFKEKEFQSLCNLLKKLNLQSGFRKRWKKWSIESQLQYKHKVCQFHNSLAYNFKWVRLDRCCWNWIRQNISIFISSNNSLTWPRNSSPWRRTNSFSNSSNMRTCLIVKRSLQFLHKRSKNKNRRGYRWSKQRRIGFTNLKRNWHFVCYSRLINRLNWFSWYYIMKSHIFSYWRSRLITWYGFWREH